MWKRSHLHAAEAFSVAYTLVLPVVLWAQVSGTCLRLIVESKPATRLHLFRLSALVPLRYREVRLGTASMAASAGGGDGSDAGGPFIDSSRLDLTRYARRPALAMVLADYLVYVERNPRKVCCGNASRRPVRT